MSQEEQVVLLLSRVNLSRMDVDSARRILNDRPVDYHVVVQLALINGVSQLLYHNLKSWNLMPPSCPQKVTKLLRQASFLTIADNAAKASETVNIITFLRKVGIESIPLKGALASEIILGNPGLYSSSDIDILVRPSDLAKTESVLAKLGYRREDGMNGMDALSSTYHLMFRGERHVVEVHWTLAFRYFDIPQDFWWEELGAVEYGGEKISALSTERYVLYTIFRLYSKAFRPLKFLVLPAEIINRYVEEIDWPKLLVLAKRHRMGRLVCFSLKLMHDLLGARVPGEVVDAKVFGYGLLKRFVLSGFSRKVSRTHIRMLLLTVLQDTPFDTLRVLFGRLFPDAGEIRLRYGLSQGSRKTCLYYVLNPFMHLFRKS